MSRDLNDTLVFVKVAELGSFVAAARSGTWKRAGW